MGEPIRVLVEAAPKRVFVCAVDFPGWSRAGRDEARAVEAFLAASSRYADVAASAGVAFPAGPLELDVIERLAGDASTEYGVPRSVGQSDRVPTDAAEAARQAALLEAAWSVFDRRVAASPESLRKGPRGGGRDRTRIVEHVNDAEAAYAGQMGIRATGMEVEARRSAMLALLRAPSDGTPLGGRRWPARYAARRIAWHVLDHAWEIEDRADSS
jgi:hypothetical protein